jgi:sigma-B regulation protein RsbU (phosphoserine phosphatase)
VLRNRGIAFKLILFFTLSSGCIFTVVFGYNYRVSRATIEQGIQENAGNVIQAATNKIEAVLGATQKVPESIAYFLEHGTYDEGELYQVLSAFVEKNPEIYGAAIAFEPYAFKKTEEYFAPYFYKSNGLLNFKHLDKHSNYFFQDWYQIPKELARPQWAEPYFGEFGGIIMSSYSVPFFRQVNGTRQLAGIVVVDVSLEGLRNIVSSVKICKTGYAFLISKNGTFVTHPLTELIMNETIFTIAEARGDMALREVGRRMIRGETGLGTFKIKSMATGKESYMAYVPIKQSGWSLGVLFPQEEILEGITKLNRNVVILGIIGLLMLSVAIFFIARSITRPLRAMAEATEGIGSGNLDVQLPAVKTDDEVGKLTKAFGFMEASLKNYIRELTEATAAKERIESELKIAHDIQMSILPKMFPPFPERSEFDIFATIEPAREVGGDFYDFFEIDEDHICFVIADVSGKGIPASLFMAVTKTLIKAEATTRTTPGEILAKVNGELCQENDMGMFVTIFCGILSINTGEIAYANAGHNPPVLLRKKEEASFLQSQGGLLAGIMEDVEYGVETITLEPGESLFLYTDGVTEAMNGNNELFTDERLRDTLEGLKEQSIKEMVRGVSAEVARFVKGAPQSDDITMMAVLFKGKEKD